MNTFLDNLNLRPQERRFVVLIAVVVFVVLNWIWVWPHFSDAGRILDDLHKARGTMQEYNTEIKLDNEPKNGLKAQLAVLQTNQGTSTIAAMSKQIQLEKTVHKQSVDAGVMINTYQPGNAPESTSQLYQKESIKITFECNEEELVNFLYNVGTDSSMIRVDDLDLHPVDANRYKLRGSALLSANYQKTALTAKSPAAAKVGTVPGERKPGLPAPGSKGAPGNPQKNPAKKP